MTRRIAHLVARRAWLSFALSMSATSCTRALQLVGGNALGDEALLGGLLAGQVLTHHRVVHRLAERHQLGRDLGGAAAGQDAPVDFATGRTAHRPAQIAMSQANSGP